MHLTGFDALAEDSGEDSGGPGLLLEAMLGALGALAVLAFVFASFLAVVPIVMAFVSIMTTFLLLLGLTQVATISPIVQFLIALIGLGVAIDYSLIVVSRWREERAHGRSGDEAVQKAMETAGRAVVFSGITVAIGLLALVALPLPFLRSMGYGGMLIPLVSVLVAITLLPVVLAKVGSRLDWPHRRTDDKASRAWTRWADARRAAPLGRRAGRHGDRARARRRGDRPAARHVRRQHDREVGRLAQAGLVALEKAGIGEGALLPHEILVEGGTDPGQVAARGAPAWTASTAPWRRPTRSGAATAPRSSRRSRSPTAARREGRRHARRACASAAHAVGPDVRVGGQPASNADFIDAVYGSFPLMIALIAITTFILLARAFRSLLLPREGDRAERAQRGRGLGRARARVAARLRLGGDLGRPGHRLDPVVDAADDLRVPVRALDGLRGVHPRPDARGVRPHRLDRARRSCTGIGRTGRLVTSAALILFLRSSRWRRARAPT